MRKVAVFFLEGLTELLIVEKILMELCVGKSIEIERTTLKEEEVETRKISSGSMPRQLYFLLIDCGGDSKVVSAIKDRGKNLEKEYENILGLKDLYSNVYMRQCEKIGKPHQIVPEIVETIKKITCSQLSEFTKVSFHFSIMETEAWLLALPQLLHRENQNFDFQKLEKDHGKLFDIDPEITFLKPSKVISDIYWTVYSHYDKNKTQLDSLIQKITKEDLENLYASKKVESFRSFYKKIKTFLMDDSENVGGSL